MPRDYKNPKTKKRMYKKGYNKKFVKKKYNALYDPKVLTGPEKKWADVTSVLSPPIGSAFVVTPAHLNPIVGGTGAALQRIGIKVRHTSLKFRANVLWPGGQTTSSPSQVRFVIVFDRQCNQGIATRTDVFADGTLGYSPINLINSERFVVIADEYSDQPTNGQFAVTYECFRKFSLEGIWPSSTAIPTTGAFLLFVATNMDINDVTTAQLPTVQFYSRIRYTDV